MHMRNKQLGVSMMGLLMGAAILIAIAVIGMKLAPSYIEYFAVKKSVNALASEAKGGSTVNDIRRSFDQRATIDDINSVKGSDLEVTKDAGNIVVAVTYRKEIPLAGNIGVYIDFSASSKD
jgi:hypothetical protein